MPASYQPPFTISPKIIRLISDISEKLGRMAVREDMRSLKLRRIDRIRTIQGSLAIEGNTLSEKQITAILDGKHVIAPPKEVLEVRNAIKAYDQFECWQPANEKHLLEAHKELMLGLIDDAGHYRLGNVGVMSGDKVVHMAPQSDRIPRLMRDLLSWLETTEQHSLIASSVFHYEFEFIHPFADGNGRMGRLWQTLILSQWNHFLAQLPVESMIHTNQEAYYLAIQSSTKKTDSAPFIEFMLSTILDTIEESITKHSPQDAPHVTPQVVALLKCLSEHTIPLNREEAQTKLDLKDRKSFRERYLKPALAAGLIKMTIPDKPNSKLQQYRLTELGFELATSFN